MGLRLFLFYDDIEEILVAAADKGDAFAVIEERWGAEAADALIMASLSEVKPETAEDLLKDKSRGILYHNVFGVSEPTQGRFKRELLVDPAPYAIIDETEHPRIVKHFYTSGEVTQYYKEKST